MVEVMKIIETSFRRSHAGTAALSASDPEAGHCQPVPLMEITMLYVAEIHKFPNYIVQIFNHVESPLHNQ